MVYFTLFDQESSWLSCWLSSTQKFCLARCALFRCARLSIGMQYADHSHVSWKEALACYNFHDRTHSRACHVVARWAVTTRAHASTSNRRKMRYLADESSQITSHIRWRYTCTRIKADTACIIQSCLPPSPPARQLKRRTAGSPGEAALNEIETRSRRTPVISLAAAVWPWGVSVQAHSNRPCSW